MHNAALAALGLHYVYIPFSVEPDAVGPAIQSLPKLGIVGVNLTIPHKERVLPFLDEVAPEARIVGAVNTVHAVEGRLIGHNTDGEGFMASLRENLPQDWVSGEQPPSLQEVPPGLGVRGPRGRVVVLGAGGAARSVVYRLARDGATVHIANRTRERARRLAEEMRNHLPDSEIVDAALDHSLAQELELAGLVVNTTSAGMHPNQEEIPPIPLEALHKDQIVYDLIYRPLETKLLAAARKRGAQTINGVDMLVHQGAAALKIWTGADPPVDIMKQAVLEELRNQ